MLVFVIFTFGANAASLGPLVGALARGARRLVIGLSLGGTTGYAINPARDLGPRIIHAILPIPGKGSSDWEYSWIPVVGPLIGGALAAVVYYVGFTRLHPATSAKTDLISVGIAAIPSAGGNGPAPALRSGPSASDEQPAG